MRYILSDTAAISSYQIENLADGGYAVLKNTKAKGFIEKDSGEIVFHGDEPDEIELDDPPRSGSFLERDRISEYGRTSLADVVKSEHQRRFNNRAGRCNSTYRKPFRFYLIFIG